MGLETFGDIDDLVATNPVNNTDTVASMGAHIRGIKSTLQTDFPNITGPMTSNEAELNLLDGQIGGFLNTAISTGGGTADAITADFTPNISLTDGVTVIVRAQGANTITNPTFNPDGLGVKTIVKNNNDALGIGDIAGASHELILKYNSSNDNWSLLNPVASRATFVNSSGGYPAMHAAASALVVDSVITEASWESVGPTGSGADNIWTELDNVPTDVDWIEAKTFIQSSASGSTASSAANTRLKARDSGSSASADVDTVIAYATSYTDASGDGYGATVVSFKIPVTSRIFEMTWHESIFTTSSIDLYLVGYGYN